MKNDLITVANVYKVNPSHDDLLERAIAGAWQLRVQSSLFLCIHERHSVLITM